MDTFLCVDLGGTKLLIGEVDGNGAILRKKVYVSSFIDQKSALNNIIISLEDYIETVGWEKEKPKAMGVGLVGRVDTQKGIWCEIDPHHSSPLNIASILSERFGIPCFIDNDVKSATRAERIWGYGKETNDFIYINVGTGIAAGIVSEGKLIRGNSYNAGEIGHTGVCSGYGIKCLCGREDCVELLASGMGFDTCARLLIDKYETSLVISENTSEKVHVQTICDLAKKGDKLCTVLVENATKALADLIMNVVRTTDPETVVLGGGVVSNDYLFPEILSRLTPETMRFVKNGVVLTKLNPHYAGLLGACATAMNQ